MHHRQFLSCFCGIKKFAFVPFKSKSTLSKVILNTMNTIYLRHIADNAQFQINFHYRNENAQIDRAFNFSRNISESVSATLDRIRVNVEKEITKSTRKNKKYAKIANGVIVEAVLNGSTQLQVQFLLDNVKVNETETMSDLFAVAGQLVFQLGEQSYSVAFNHPWIDSVLLPKSVLSGCYIYPTRVDVQCCRKEDIEFEWYKNVKPFDMKCLDWIPIGSGFIHLLSNDDVGHRLKVICTPKNDKLIGPPIEVIFKDLIMIGPKECPFEKRQEFTKHYLSDDKFRITSYNILADLYCDSDYSRRVLFPYCPEYALGLDYRKQLIIRELLGYKSDIICLQEVDTKVFNHDLEPLLELNEYQGRFKNKGTTAEGLAIFFKSSRFSLIEQYGITIGENIPTLDIFSDLWKLIEQNKQLAQRIVNRSTAILVLVLQSKDTGKYLIVANTHLYFHPDADHIRLLQMGMNMRYVQYIYNETKTKHNLTDSSISIVFAGDFNSVPECGIFKLMTTKSVPDDFIDYQSNLYEVCKGVHLKQPFNIKSSYKNLAYTNFTTLFSGWIDYIFYQTDHLKMLQCVPMPTDAEIKENTAIPSVCFPSDHIALITDFQWK